MIHALGVAAIGALVAGAYYGPVGAAFVLLGVFAAASFARFAWWVIRFPG